MHRLRLLNLDTEVIEVFESDASDTIKVPEGNYGLISDLPRCSIRLGSPLRLFQEVVATTGVTKNDKALESVLRV